MPRRVGRALLASIMVVGAACGRTEQADLVLQNGVVYPVASDTATAQAVAIRDRRIVFVGSATEAAGFIGGRTRVIDLGGRMVLPGFHDTHLHPEGGVGLAECTLEGLSTATEILDSIRRYATAHPDLPWIRGRGWQLPAFPGANPRREWLDSIVPDRPVYLSAADGHSAWVNSRALALAGISRDTPDPVNGRIERDPATGEPSGTLRETAARLVASQLPPRSREEIRAGLRRAIAMGNRFGITSMHEANAGPALLEAYAALDSARQLDARVVAALSTDPQGGVAQVDSLRSWRGRYAGRRYYSPRAAKIFVDGVIEARTAALLEPYLGGGGRGEPRLSPGQMDTLVAALDGAGFQVHVHAIGDRAVRMALDAFAFARRHNGPRDARPIITHLELVDSSDIPRFAELGVVASFQSLWAYRDSYIRDLTEPVLGAARSRWLYPIGAMARAGAHLAGASDWSVSSMNPLEAIQVAVTRRDPDAPSGPAWLPEQTVTLAEMLGAYTLGGAWAAHEEATNGTLEPGKDADLIVLDRNLYRIPITEVHAARVLLTLMDGRVVFRDSTFTLEGTRP